MKIAYIFHGHARTWEQCYQNFFYNVYSVAPGDIFIHTWNTSNPSFGSYWSGWKDFSGEILEIASKPPKFSEIYEAYKPKVLMIEQDKPPDFTNYPDYINDVTSKARLGTKNMLESSRKIFEIARSFGDYDKFFSTRLDINYISQFSKTELHSNNFIIAHPAVIDVWMMGNAEQMDIKTQYFWHIDEYWFKTQGFINNNVCYEEALLSYMKDKGIGNIQVSELQYHTPRIF